MGLKRMFDPKALGLIFLALFWTLSCGSAPAATPIPEPTPTPSPHQIIEKSGGRMLALDTARFTLEHEGDSSTQLFPGVTLQRVEGQVDMPNRFRIRAEAMSAFPRSFIEVNIVVVEDQAFMTDFINREKWNQVPVENLPFNFADLGRTLSDIIRAIQNPAFTGTETVDGVSSWRVRGTVPSESLAALVPEAGSGHEVALDLWVGQAQGLLIKVRIEGQILSTDVPKVVRVLTLYSFDEPVEISLPKMQ